MTIKGIIFDMDGVVTQTAIIHYKAWKAIIDELLAKIYSCFSPFTEEDYFYYLDGMSRIDGMTNFLKARQISTKELAHLYNSIEECITDICERKNAYLLSIIATEKIECYPDTIEFIEYLILNNYSIAIISSSKNCEEILKSASVDNLFPVRVDGKIAESIGIPGKPHPAIFLEAAKKLNLLDRKSVV